MYVTRVNWGGGGGYEHFTQDEQKPQLKICVNGQRVQINAPHQQFLFVFIYLRFFFSVFCISFVNPSVNSGLKGFREDFQLR